MPIPVLLTGIADCLAAFRQGDRALKWVFISTSISISRRRVLSKLRGCASRSTWLGWKSTRYDPEGLRLIRDRASMPIASCESLFGRRQYRPFFENRSMDVAIMDVPWNGLAEAVKIASMADAYEINCAPHNFYGHLATMMGASSGGDHPEFRDHGSRYRRRPLEGRSRHANSRD